MDTAIPASNKIRTGFVRSGPAVSCDPRACMARASSMKQSSSISDRGNAGIASTANCIKHPLNPGRIGAVAQQ
eukprot:364180-Chlamydomonas_euryale.AAC.18